MRKKIVWVNPEPPHNLVLLHPAYNGEARQSFPSDDELLAFVLNRDLLIHPNYRPGIPYELVDEEDWPTDHTFVDAWQCTAGKITTNMPKARLIHMDRIRQVRDLELRSRDVPFMKALEAGDTVEQNRIAAEKQALRDIPQTLSLSGARTPTQLKALWPPDLPRPVLS